MPPERTRLTVILPTYKRPEFLRKALESVMAQDFADFTIRVYDNASGDGTAAVVEEFARIRGNVGYHCHEKNIGARANFLFGLLQVDTPFFCFLSDDDLMLPGFLSTAMEAFDRHPSALFSALQSLNIDNDDRVWAITGDGWPTGYYAGKPGIDAFCAHGHLIWTGIVFAKSAMPDFAGLMERYEVVSDLAAQLSLVLRGPFAVTARPGAAFRSHPSSYSQMSFKQIADETAEMIDLVVTRSAIEPGMKAGIAGTVKAPLYNMVFGMWPRLVQGSDNPGPVLEYFAWLRGWRAKSIGGFDRKLFVLTSLVRITLIAPFIFGPLKRALGRRNARIQARSAADPKLGPLQNLLTAKAAASADAL